ncbi:hypothetical protein [Chitinophaga japonensis]|nr:hypothetical protein [Chitinophaga japonensis]
MLFIIYKGAVKAVQQHDANAAKVAGMLAVLLVLAVIIRRKK